MFEKAFTKVEQHKNGGAKTEEKLTMEEKRNDKQ
jgi:hypothetical protein